MRIAQIVYVKRFGKIIKRHNKIVCYFYNEVRQISEEFTVFQVLKPKLKM